MLSRMHCEHGATLLAQWNFPESFKTIVLRQNDEKPDLHNTLLCMIRLVDKACILEGIIDMPFDEVNDLESMPEVKALSLTTQDLDELRAVLQEVSEEKQAAA